MLLIENTKVLCKNGKLVIPTPLQKQVVQWYHHYLQHPRHSHLEETLKLRCIGKVCALLSDHMSKSANPAKPIKDEAKIWKTSNQNSYNDSMGSIMR